MKLVDLTGQRFGRLTVIERAESQTRSDGSKISRWLCKCDCGNTKIVRQSNLVSGHIKSCGCLRIEKTIARNQIHCESYSRVYTIWENIKQRCFDSGCKNYTRYGGRGITLCDEWRYSFEAFRDWAMKNGYNDTMSIDRIDNNGNYEPINCRWVSNKVQANNRRSNRMITYCGKTQTLSQWADELGIDYKRLWARLYKCNWPIEKAFKAP